MGLCLVLLGPVCRWGFQRRVSKTAIFDGAKSIRLSLDGFVLSLFVYLNACPVSPRQVE